MPINTISVGTIPPQSEIRTLPSTTPDTIAAELDKRTNGKFVYIPIGNSGKGYAKEQQQELKDNIRSDIKAYVEKHGKDNVLVLTGGTPEGVGISAEIAKEEGVETLGVVSEKAENQTSRFCDHVLFVKDPESTWKVLSPGGESYTVMAAKLAKKNGLGSLIKAYGGGEVTKSELIEAHDNRIQTEIDVHYNPENPDHPTPVRDWLNSQY